MKGKRFTEEQIIGVLKETESGGMTVSEARRLKQLEAENSKLKRLLLSKPIGKPSVGFWPNPAVQTPRKPPFRCPGPPLETRALSPVPDSRQGPPREYD